VANALVNVFATVLIGLLVLLSLRDILRAPRMLKAFHAARSGDAAETNAPAGNPDD
jgi:hypothetical protein